ncbi:Crp/Fnr family transcriptional regulator [Lutibacter sp. B1]|uniref:Crp/Fnr family transcriptional regulator n=1 Tax=Lutibacter sp. B1 TaxID=2725996 RepID=UPI0014573246|nr:Crp/Fnr family transcriptional regulator [Lutibacter sp. B1]NLP56917.1 Crp/Fnr family transcriptional regulator [Lutibacter sp. B1]
MPYFLNKKSHFDYEFLNAKECLNILTEDEKNELVKHKTDIVFEAGETIIKRGLLANSILYLNEGLVKLDFINNDKPSTLSLIKPHSFIGIICCFAFKKYDFTVTAIEKTKISFIDMDVFENFIKSNGEFAFHLIKHMSGVTNILFHRITTLSQNNIDGALSFLLLDFAKIYNSNKYTLPVSRIEIANIIGYSKESAINTLSKFNKEGIIKVTGKKIELLDVEKLEQICKTG